jgi:hypothetical protein
MKSRIIDNDYIKKSFEKLYGKFFEQCLIRILTINNKNKLSILFKNLSSNLIDHTHIEF